MGFNIYIKGLIKPTHTRCGYHAPSSNRLGHRPFTAAMVGSSPPGVIKVCFEPSRIKQKVKTIFPCF